MIFRHKTHTSIRIFVDSEKSAKFNDYLLETEDDETAEMLRSREDVEEMDVEEDAEEEVQETPDEQPETPASDEQPEKPAPKRRARKTKENNEV